MIKLSVLKRLKRTTRGKGKQDRMEWALVSKSNPKKILKWFGPEKPSKKMIAKEERRIHAFSSINNSNKVNEVFMKKELIMMANHLDKSGYKKEADFLDSLIQKRADEVMEGPLYLDNDKRPAELIEYPESEGDTVGPALFPPEARSFARTKELTDAIIKEDEHYYSLSEEEQLKYVLKEMKLVIARLKIFDNYGAILERMSGLREKKMIEALERQYLESLNQEHAEHGKEFIFNKYTNIVGGLMDDKYGLTQKYMELTAPEEEMLDSIALGQPIIIQEERIPGGPILAEELVKDLVKLSNHLDSIGNYKAADKLDLLIKSAKKKNKKKKPSKKQLKSLDKNRNGKIDKEDFKILRRKRKENKADGSEAMKKCAKCGHMNHHDAKKCSKCGHTKFEK